MISATILSPVAAKECLSRNDSVGRPGFLCPVPEQYLATTEVVVVRTGPRPTNLSTQTYHALHPTHHRHPGLRVVFGHAHLRG